MLFNSLEFLFLFLPATLLVFFLLARRSPRAAIVWLSLASVFFYSWWDIRFLPVLLLSILFNFGMAHGIVRAGGRGGSVLALAVAGNLSALFFYKYLDFSIGSVNTLLGLSLPAQNLELPLGISFFTFTQIAYLVDVHRGKADTSHPANYILFVTYFPHLIAGPILHHAQMMPQFRLPSVFRPDPVCLAGGLLFLTIGLVKKILVADNLAGHASPVFALPVDAGPIGMIEAWTAALAYTLQLYFDFSGYCDMALGVSLMFNIRLPLNFASPYKAANIIEFWRCWHMTLSQFLRDYLYIPLGGNRFGVLRRYQNLFITMLLGGLWHGANWTFVVWGCLHGVFLIANHGFLALREKLRLPAMPRATGIALTLTVVVFAWVPFRADSLTQALALWQAMLGANPGADILSGIRPGKAAGWIAGGLLVVLLLPNSQDIVQRFQIRLQGAALQTDRAWLALGLLLGIVFSLTAMSIGHVSEFLYFQF